MFLLHEKISKFSSFLSSAVVNNAMIYNQQLLIRQPISMMSPLATITILRLASITTPTVM